MTEKDPKAARPVKRQPDLNSVYTINPDGSRNMLQVADVKGRWTTRKYFMYALLIIVYVVAPWITIGKGTTLNFEDDLDLGKGSVVPSFAFEWQIGRKHRLGVRWQDISRDSNAQALTESHWGDEVIPIDADITLSFATTQAFIDYTYYPWVKDRWAMGFGLGFRVMDISSTLTWEETTIGGGEGTAKGTAPLPYLYFEYRRLFSDHWRFVTGLGWLYLSIEDIKGGQWLGRASIEYLLGETWAFGAALNLSTIGVDWEGDEFLGRFEIDVNDISLFARIRF